MTQTAVLGAGSWGTTFAQVMADAGVSQVRIWGRRQEVCDQINNDHRNEAYLPGMPLPETISASTDIAEVLEGAHAVAIALPAQSVSSELERISQLWPETALALSLMKGVELGTSRRMSEVVSHAIDLDPSRVAVVSGPNLAREIAARQPTATVVAAPTLAVAEQVSALCASSYFRPYTNTDVVGVELGGAVKNVIALAVGIAQGCGYGDNTKATIITRGLVEMARLGVALGAESKTFSGLAGLGDLVATCASPLSRNHRVGVHIGQGLTLAESVATTGQTAEGAKSCRSILALGRSINVEMPITEAVVAVLYDGLSVAKMTELLLTRPYKSEGI